MQRANASLRLTTIAIASLALLGGRSTRSQEETEAERPQGQREHKRGARQAEWKADGGRLDEHVDKARSGQDEVVEHWAHI